MTDDAGIGGQYRYPGAPPFGDSELDRRLFRGRTDEAETVLHSILSSDLFLLYAESGLGKTSLLNAGVLHELRSRGHWPVSVRLNDTSTSPVDGIREQILQAAASDASVDLDIDDATLRAGSDLSLWDLLGSIEVWRGNELQRLVLIIDQFEELFTLGWDEPTRRRFITEFGEVARHHRDGTGDGDGVPPPDVRFVLVIREDSLGSLEELATDVPRIMRNRFRLGPLDPERAEAAIREPAGVDDPRLESLRFEYSEEAAAEILDFLRTSSVRGATALAGGVDPSQLQIVCHYVERAIVPQKAAGRPAASVVRIEAADLGGKAGLDQILSRFYRRTVAALPAADQRAVRALCEEGLINRNGRRLSLELDTIGTGFGVSPAVLDALVDGRLLRAEPRVGSVYYELAHDTLVAAIVADRDERRAHRRRRRLALAATVVGVFAALVVLASLVAAFGSDSDSVAEQETRLGVGESASLEIGESGEVTLTVDAPDGGAIEFTAVPSPGIDAELRVIDSSGESAVADAGHDPLSVVMVASPGSPEDYAVTISTRSGSRGTVEINARELAPFPLTGSAEDQLDAPGEKIVYAVDVGRSPLVVDVVPLAVGDEPASLDAGIEVFGPVRQSVDDRVGTVAERIALTEPGRYLIVVEGLPPDPSGGFAISATTAVPVAAGAPETVALVAGDPAAYFELRGEGVRAFAVTARDPELDVEVQLLVDGDERRVIDDSDGQELWFTEDGDGVVLAAVRPTGESDRDDGDITIEVSEPAARLGTGDEAGVGGGLSVHALVNDGGELLEVAVRPDADAALEVLVRDDRGFPVDLPVSGRPDGGRSVILDRDDTGPFRFVVVADASATIAVEELADPEPDGAEVAASGSRPFDITVESGEQLELAVIGDPASGPSIDVAVTDAAGAPIRSDRTIAPGDSVGVMLGCDGAVGNLRVAVTAFEERERTTEYSVRLRKKPADDDSDWCAPPVAPDVIIGPTVSSLLTRSGAAPELAACTVRNLLTATDDASSLDRVVGLLAAFDRAAQLDDPVERTREVDVIVETIAVFARDDCGVADDTILRARDRVFAFLDENESVTGF